MKPVRGAEEWFAFEETFYKSVAEEWLRDNGIKATFKHSESVGAC